MTFDQAESVLFDEVSKMGARPDIPREAEEYFTRLVADYHDLESLRSYLRPHVDTLYTSVGNLPDWIQDADWPWDHDRPMVFVGSLDVAKGMFHDDARFFVFWSPHSGSTKCVIQVA